MNKKIRKVIAFLSLILLLASMVAVPGEVEAAIAFYVDYTVVA